MTICQALLWATEKLTFRPFGKLKAQGLRKITSAELDAEVILSYVAQKPRAWLLGNPKSEILNPKQTPNSKFLKFKTLILRRAKGVPVAYLTRRKEFYGLDFYVDERVLVPRPETELLADEILKLLQKKLTIEHRPLNIIDIGTGSGCIAIALAKNLMANASCLMPHASCLMPQIYATDISADALTVAQGNARKHNVKINFFHGNLLEPIIKRKIRPDIIIANLPYLKPNEIKGDIRHEPRQALDGGKDGLEYYRQILRQISKTKIQDTRYKVQINFKSQTLNSEIISNIKYPINYYLLFEIDPRQARKIRRLVRKYLPTATVEIKKDLAGWERMACVTIHEAHNTRRLNHDM